MVRVYKSKNIRGTWTIEQILMAVEAVKADKSPNGTIGVSTKSGWINEETFSKWFDHFLQQIQPKMRLKPVVLIMDGHTSHTKNLLIIEKARANNVILLSFPSHCTHRMQPLDVSFFKSLKNYYDKEVQCWLRRHPGRPVTDSQIAELFSTAYGYAASVGNAVSGGAKNNELKKNESTEVSRPTSKMTKSKGKGSLKANHQKLIPHPVQHVRNVIAMKN